LRDWIGVLLCVAAGWVERSTADGGNLGFARNGGCLGFARSALEAGWRRVWRSSADGGLSRVRTVQIAFMGRSVGVDCSTLIGC
jgi:hypothetical protein